MHRPETSFHDGIQRLAAVLVGARVVDEALLGRRLIAASPAPAGAFAPVAATTAATPSAMTRATPLGGTTPAALGGPPGLGTSAVRTLPAVRIGR